MVFSTAALVLLSSWWLIIGYLILAWLLLSFLLLYVRHVLPFRLAKVPLLRGNYDRALRRLRLFEWLHITSASVLYLKGTTLMFAGRNQEAETALRKCLDIQQGRGEKSVGLVNLGYVLLEQRRYADAAEVLDRAIQIRPDGAVAYSSRAEVYLRQGVEPEKALELLEKGIKYKQGSEKQSGVDRHILGYLFANRLGAVSLKSAG